MRAQFVREAWSAVFTDISRAASLFGKAISSFASILAGKQYPLDWLMLRHGQSSNTAERRLVDDLRKSGWKGIDKFISIHIPDKTPEKA